MACRRSRAARKKIALRRMRLALLPWTGQRWPVATALSLPLETAEPEHLQSRCYFCRSTSRLALHRSSSLSSAPGISYALFLGHSAGKTLSHCPQTRPGVRVGPAHWHTKPASAFTSPARCWRKIEHVTYRTPKQTSRYIYFHQHTPWCSPDSRPHHLLPAKHCRTCALWSWTSLASVFTAGCHPRVRRAPSRPSHHRCRSPYTVFALPVLASINVSCICRLPHTSYSVFGALAVLSTFTVDASVCIVSLGLDANAPK
jgi:hypothetical protein